MQAVIHKNEAVKRLNNDEAVFRRICAIVLDYTPMQAEKLKVALNEKDNDQIIRLAHSIKSEAASIGADLLRDIAQQLEFAGRANVPEQAAECFVKLENELENVLQVLPELI